MGQLNEIIKPLIFEEWLPITEQIMPGVYPFYYISNFGRIYSTNKSSPLGAHMLCPSNNGKGYLQIPLGTVNGRKTMKVHRLVLLTFNYNPDCDNLEVNHIDGNRMNNCIWNLEWCTSSYNTIHAINHGVKNICFNTDFHDVLPDSEIHNLLLEYKNGATCEYLCMKYNYSEISIRNLIAGHNRPNISRLYNLPKDKYIQEILKYMDDNIWGDITRMKYDSVAVDDIVQIVLSKYHFPRELAYEIAIKRIYHLV